MISNAAISEVRPIKFLHPTQAIYSNVAQATSTQPEHIEAANTTAGGSKATSTPNVQALPANVQYKWTSRDNRKGRHTLVVPPSTPNNLETPPPTTTPKATVHGIWRMLTYYPYWDISYLVAVSFTLGSLVWVLDSFFVFLPLAYPSTEFAGEVLYAGGITAFVGVVIFEIGGVLLVLEAINENHERCFGWAVERWYEGRSKDDDEDDGKDTLVKVLPAADSRSHQNQNSTNAEAPSEDVPRQPTLKLLDPKPMHTNSWHPLAKSPLEPSPPKHWIWWPSHRALKTHYFRSIGFLASLILFVAATVFFVSGLTSLPGIINTMSFRETIAFYWVPQLIGGVGFVISGWMFMVETQKHWWKPALDILGWHVGFWNLVGGIGFLLCPCFGLDSRPWAQYQACLATFWGSCAFLVGSLIQWYECLEKNPVVVGKGSGARR